MNKAKMCGKGIKYRSGQPGELKFKAKMYFFWKYWYNKQMKPTDKNILHHYLLVFSVSTQASLHLCLGSSLSLRQNWLPKLVVLYQKSCLKQNKINSKKCTIFFKIHSWAEFHPKKFVLKGFRCIHKGFLHSEEEKKDTRNYYNVLIISW